MRKSMYCIRDCT
jgi:hypothetical protein